MVLSGYGTLIDLTGVLIAVILIIFTYFKWSYQYWKKRNIPSLKPTIPFGTFPNPLNQETTGGIEAKIMYEQVKLNKWRHAGLYSVTTPFYMPIDLEYVKNIMTKDFQYFVDRGFYYNEEDDPLSAHLFALGGVKWRNLRTKMTPTFTSGKMRMMFQTLVDCEKNLQQVVETKCDNNEPLDIKEILGCFTTDIIGSCAFGLEFNTFKEDDSPFRRYGRKVFHMSRWRIVLFIISQNFPDFARKLHIRSFVEKDVTDFFINIVKETVQHREKNNIQRKDFMQLLIDLKNNKLSEEGYKHDGNTLTLEELAAQSFIFFLAGFETSSTTMTFALYELARHPNIQERLREEINQVLAKHNNQITYEAITEMKYMNQVIDETLRKYPPVPFVTRLCVKNYKIPDQDIVIEEGTRVLIPIMGIHHDTDYYDDPEKFDPERFTEENKAKRHPYAHIPFGEGPRICIGLRFGLMQTKIGLTSLLRNFKFTVHSKTREPLKMLPASFILTAEGDIWLKGEKINS